MSLHTSRQLAAHFSLSRAAWVIAVWAAAILMAVAVTAFGSVAAAPDGALCASSSSGDSQGSQPIAPDPRRVDDAPTD